MMRAVAQWMKVLACIVLLGALPGVAGAKTSSMGKSKQSTNQSKSSNKPVPAQKVNPNLAADQAAAAAANDALVKAEAALNAIKTKLETAFHESSDWTSAQAALHQAQADYQAATVPALAALKSSNSDYASALGAKEKIIADLDAAHKADPPDTAAISALATDQLAAEQKVRDFEIAALESDSATAAAKTKMTTASSAIDALTADFKKTCEQDKDWMAAKAAYDDAKTKADAANAKVTADGG